MRVKGKATPVTLFTPLVQEVARTPTFLDELRHWQLALAQYRLQHWDDAQAELRRLRSVDPNSWLAGLAQRLDERIAELRRTPPPADWDGAYTFDSK